MLLLFDFKPYPDIIEKYTQASSEELFQLCITLFPTNVIYHRVGERGGTVVLSRDGCMRLFDVRVYLGLELKERSLYYQPESPSDTTYKYDGSGNILPLKKNKSFSIYPPNLYRVITHTRMSEDFKKHVSFCMVQYHTTHAHQYHKKCITNRLSQFVSKRDLKFAESVFPTFLVFVDRVGKYSKDGGDGGVEL